MWYRRQEHDQTADSHEIIAGSFFKGIWECFEKEIKLKEQSMARNGKSAKKEEDIAFKSRIKVNKVNFNGEICGWK